jgi:hypothetical protein
MTTRHGGVHIETSSEAYRPPTILSTEGAKRRDRFTRALDYQEPDRVTILDFYKEAGIDVPVGVNPAQNTHTDMAVI